MTTIESSGETFQSSKKSDEKHDDAFASQLAIQKAFAEVNASDGQSTPSKPSPITSGIRRTLRYLYYLAGPFAPFRGFHIYLVHFGMDWLLEKTFKLALELVGLDPKSTYPEFFIGLLIQAFTFPISLANVHYIISHDPPISFRPRRHLLSRSFSLSGLLFLVRQIPLPRLPSRSAMKAMIFPVIIAASMEGFWRVLPESLIYTWVLRPMLEANKLDDSSFVPPSKIVGVLASAYFVEVTAVKVLSYMASRIAHVLLTRVEASLLPEEAQSVVPFDRAFGLKPSVRGRAAQGITLLEAWQTLPWNIVWRLFKLHVKLFCLKICLGIIQGIALAVVTALTPGDHKHIEKVM